MVKLLMVAAGGALGAVSRYLVAGWAQKLAGPGFPVGTMTANVAGCFLIGVLAAAFAGPVLIREEYRLAIMVGFLGGFTTFSTYGFETFSLMNDGQRLRALGNVVLSNGLGLAAVWLGYRWAERWYGA